MLKRMEVLFHRLIDPYKEIKSILDKIKRNK